MLDELKKNIVVAVAVVCIGVIMVVALALGHDTGLIYTGVGVIAGLAGYHINQNPPASKP